MTGNPIRKEILAEVLMGENPPARRAPRICRQGAGDFRLLVFGGSAGAHSINQAFVAALPFLSRFRERLAITHQTGENDLAEVREAYQRENFGARAVAFIDNMAGAYRSADLVVCRAGATTVAEVTACGKACIFIPYPYAVDDHQRRNAEALLKKNAGFMLLDRELSGESLAPVDHGLDRQSGADRGGGPKREKPCQARCGAGDRDGNGEVGKPCSLPTGR